MKRPDADPILRDNRKNRPRFLVICLVCLLGGAALGYAAAALTDPDAFARADRAAGRLAGALAPFALLAAVPFLAAGFWMYRRARALFAGWDEAALLPIGPLPVLAATVPWAVSQFAYLAVCLRARSDGL